VERRDPAICNASTIGEGKDEMTKASIGLQDLRRRIYVKAKAEPSWRFWGLYVHVCKVETLRAAYEISRRQLAHAQKRKGFGWERWSRQWLYDTLGLVNGYRVRRDRPKVAQQDRSHKPRHEANGGAQCGKSARCVRRGGGWKRGAVETLRPKPARQSSTLPRLVCHWPGQGPQAHSAHRPAG
jgi:hypothetical protein